SGKPYPCCAARHQRDFSAKIEVHSSLLVRRRRRTALRYRAGARNQDRARSPRRAPTRSVFNEITHPQPAAVEAVQLNGFDTTIAVTHSVVVVARGLFTIDDGFPDFDAAARL